MLFARSNGCILRADIRVLASFDRLIPPQPICFLSNACFCIVASFSFPKKFEVEADQTVTTIAINDANQPQSSGNLVICSEILFSCIAKPVLRSASTICEFEALMSRWV